MRGETRMVTVETIGKVRRAYWVQKKKIKAIARELKLARNTVRSIVRSGETAPVYYARRSRCRSLGFLSRRSISCLKRMQASPSASG